TPHKTACSSSFVEEVSVNRLQRSFPESSPRSISCGGVSRNSIDNSRQPATPIRLRGSTLISVNRAELCREGTYAFRGRPLPGDCVKARYSCSTFFRAQG